MDVGEAVFEDEAESAASRARPVQRRVTTGKLKTLASSVDGDVDESTSLIPDQVPGDDDGDDDEPQKTAWQMDAQFAGLPWYRRPSIYWVILPFFVVACAFGGIMTPKVNLVLDLICREYLAEQAGGVSSVPHVFARQVLDECGQIVDVRKRTAEFNIWAGLISGIISAITSPKLGALSDRYGRKPLLIVSSLGTILGEIITIFAAKYPESFPVQLLLLSYAIDGLTGSFIIASALCSAYATDCTPPHLRNNALGVFHACLFTGISLGPLIAGLIVKQTGQIVVVFYILTGVHVFVMLFIGFAVPESLSRRRMTQARERHAVAKQQSTLDPDLASITKPFTNLNILEPLRILWPTSYGSSPLLRRNLITLAAVEFLIFGVAMSSMTIVAIYTRGAFGWQTYETGIFQSVVSGARVVCLVTVLPLLTRLVRGPSPAKTPALGSDTFDLSVLRLAILFDLFGYIGYTFSHSGATFMLSGVIAALGSMGPPTLQAALTKHVPADQVGQLLGATGLLHSLARVIAPTLFNAIYVATEGVFPSAVFLCLAGMFVIAFVVSWIIRPHVYFDEVAAARARDEEDAAAAAVSAESPPAPFSDA